MYDSIQNVYSVTMPVSLNAKDILRDSVGTVFEIEKTFGRIVGNRTNIA